MASGGARDQGEESFVAGRIKVADRGAPRHGVRADEEAPAPERHRGFALPADACQREPGWAAAGFAHVATSISPCPTASLLGPYVRVAPLIIL